MPCGGDWKVKDLKQLLYGKQLKKLISATLYTWKNY